VRQCLYDVGMDTTQKTSVFYRYAIQSQVVTLVLTRLDYGNAVLVYLVYSNYSWH